METYAAAYSTWKSVRVRLDHTIQDYLDACAQLRDALSMPPPSISCREFREQRLMELDRERQSFLSHTQHLQRAESYLSLVRNTSHTLSPIALLPHDVLCTMLAVTVQPGAHKHGPRAMRTHAALITTLSSVCTTWRQAMLHTPGFWTAPELVLQGTASQPNYQLARLWAERSRDAVVDLFIYDRRDCLRPTLVPLGWSTAIVEELIITLMPRVRTLNIGASYDFIRASLRSVVNCWATHGTTNRAERLDVWERDNGRWNAERLAIIVPSTYADIGEDAFIKFFSSIRSLWVCGVWTGVQQIAHAGLVELRIQNILHWYPTLSDIGTLLTAMPRLRLLALLGITIVEGSDEPHVVTMDHLDTLILRYESVWQVMDIITTSNNIELGISVVEDPQCIPTIRSFFTRTQISRLHLIACNPVQAGFISTALFSIPYVRELALDNFAFPDELLQINLQESSSDIWPVLREIQMVGCYATPLALDQLIAIHPPETLLWYTEPGYSSINSDAYAEVEERLSGHGVKVVWVTERADLPLSSWECSK